jgi:hypothetical protein
MTKPTADPAANTVLDQSIFSAVSGETVGGNGCNGTDSEDGPREVIVVGGVFKVNVPIKEWMSFIGESAEVLVVHVYSNHGKDGLGVLTVYFGVESYYVTFGELLTFRNGDA